ncbi:MAG: hypothetical protein JSR76_02435 [Verrucomicrobia bacterium]|nr:hypothetical protein [Verrucomicrobiota bacterium]
MALRVDRAADHHPAIKEKAEARKTGSSRSHFVVIIPPHCSIHGRVYRILLEAVPRIQTCSSPLQRERALSFVTLVFEEIGNTSEALSLASTINPKAVKAACYRMARRKQHLAIGEACRVSDKNLQNIALTFVVSTLLKSGDLVRAVEASHPYLDSSKRDLLLGVVAATIEKDPSKMALFVGSPCLESIALRVVDAVVAKKFPSRNLVAFLAIQRVKHDPKKLIDSIKSALGTQNFPMVLRNLTAPLCPSTVERFVPTPDKEDWRATYQKRHRVAQQMVADILTVLTQQSPALIAMTRIAINQPQPKATAIMSEVLEQLKPKATGIMMDAIQRLSSIAAALRVLSFTRRSKTTLTGYLPPLLISSLSFELPVIRLWQGFYSLETPPELLALEKIVPPLPSMNLSFEVPWV